MTHEGRQVRVVLACSEEFIRDANEMVAVTVLGKSAYDQMKQLLEEDDEHEAT